MGTRRQLALLVPLLFAARVSGQSVDSSPLAPGPVELLAGTYKYVGNPEKDHAAIEKSIEEAITSLGWLGRRIARSRLHNHKELPQRITIARDGDDIAIVMGEYSAVAKEDGTGKDMIGPNGRDSKLHYELESHAIVQYFVFEHAKRKSTYSINKSGQLVMTVFMTSEKLASPIEYSLVYERQ